MKLPIDKRSTNQTSFTTQVLSHCVLSSVMSSAASYLEKALSGSSRSDQQIIFMILYINIHVNVMPNISRS